MGIFLRGQGLSSSFIRTVKYRPGGLLLCGQPVRTNYSVQPGDVITVTLPEEEFCSVQPEPVPFEIVYESPHAMVINKPAGMVMHPTLSHKGGTLANGFSYLMRLRGQKCAFRPLGRLDANTSGLVLCALNPYAAPLMGKTFQKTYLALAMGAMPLGKGSINAPLGPAPGSAILQQVSAQGRPSVTNYTVVASSAMGALARVNPLTGRTHQIRVHFSSIQHPLFGDELYGGTRQLIQRHALHCGGLSFTEPGGSRLCLQAPLPADMLLCMQKLELTGLV